MGSRTLTPEAAAALVMESDPLTDVRISLGYQTTLGVRRAVLRLSTKSTVDYRAKARPLGTMPGLDGHDHVQLMVNLTHAMQLWQRAQWASSGGNS